jgi:hypothetical protein
MRFAPVAVSLLLLCSAHAHATVGSMACTDDTAADPVDARWLAMKVVDGVYLVYAPTLTIDDNKVRPKVVFNSTFEALPDDSRKDRPRGKVVFNSKFD